MAFSAIGAAIAIAGTVYSAKQQSKARKSQEKAALLQQQGQEIAAQRERVKQIREARLRRATVENAAGAGGTQQSSSAITGAGSITQQAYNNIGYINVQQGINTQIYQANLDYSRALGKANTGQTIASIGSTIASNGSKISNWYDQNQTNSNLGFA